MAPTHPGTTPKNWPSARFFTESIQCPSICFSHPLLRATLPAVDRLGMPLVTSGQFAYVYKLKSRQNVGGDFAVRCFRGYLGDRDQRYRAIQEHLQTAPVSYLSEFSYAPEGILVGGNRFPILFMNWIDGPTLDLYIGEMLDRPDVLLHLSEEWLRLLNALQTSGMAHGDLQHGNIIVEHGQLRLVDHDGIFVPKMTGWTASEVGHQHYQHPRRNAQHFDAKLDRFSSLVIYLSLLALAERPQLWREHHDENLLFTKEDFADPDASSLFKKIRELGSEPARLADALAAAALGPPTNVPLLLDLVQQHSTLPGWMTAPRDIEGTTKTREVALAAPAAERRIRWIPRSERKVGPYLPVTPKSSHGQGLFGGPPAKTIVKDPHAVSLNTWNLSKDFARRYFLVWYWVTYLLLDFMGFGLFPSLLVATLILVCCSLAYGLVKAVDESTKAKRISLTSGQPRATALPATGPGSWNPKINLPPASVTSTGSVDAFIGNRVLGIYHSKSCQWVDSIPAKNREGFADRAEALSHGFKPCHICAGTS